MPALEMPSLTRTGQNVPTGSTEFAVSEVVAALKAAWSGIATRHPDLPRVSIVVASGIECTSLRRLGHWAPIRWTVENGSRVGEVFIAGEWLEQGAIGAFETLLHESARALAFVRNIKDHSRRGRYHNAR